MAMILAFNASSNNSLENILRNLVLENGYQPPEKLFVDKDQEFVSVGKIFFKSKHLSLNGKISCATCHIADRGSSDGIANAAGVRGLGEGKDRLMSGAKIVPRNTLGLWGVGSKNFKTFFWDGRVDFANKEIISQFGSAIPSDDPLITAVHLPVVEIRETLEEDDFILAHKKESVVGADAVYEAVVNNLKKFETDGISQLAEKIGKEESEINFLDIATSIAAFIRHEFKIKNTRLNSFVSGKKKLTNNQLKGGIIFYGKGNCISCHSGAHFSNQKFYTIPFPQLGFGKNGFGIDYGRYNATFDPNDLYKFRTPSLYNNGKTAPYGHSGSASDLSEAIKAHYDPLSLIKLENYDALQRFQYYKYLSANDAAKKINYISENEIELLIEFLGTLDFD